MSYVLIIVIVFMGKIQNAGEYKTKEACEKAAKRIIQTMTQDEIPLGPIKYSCEETK